MALTATPPASTLTLSPEVWLSIILGAVVTLIIAYIIYKIQKREAGEHLQKHEERFDELKRLHEQDSEKIRVLYELIIKSQNGSLGEVEAEALEEKIEEAADAITEDDSHQAQALKAIADKDKEEADSLLAKIAQQEHDLEELYNLHAMNEFRHGNYTGAAVWLKKLTDLLPENNDYHIRYFTALSECGQFRDAEELCTKMLAKLRAASPLEENKIADWLYSMGQVKHNQHQTAEAEDYLNQALELGIKLFGNDSFELANTYNDLGIIYMERRDFSKAEEYIRTALRIKKKEDDQDFVNTAFMTCNLASMYKSQNRLEEAEKLYKEGMQVFGDRMGYDHTVLTYYYSHLGQLYFSQYKLQAARIYLEKSIAIFEKMKLTNHPGYVGTLGLLGQICTTLKLYPEAEQNFVKNMEICLISFGKDSLHTGYAKYRYAQLCNRMHRYEEAEQLILQADAIESQNPGVSGLDRSKTFNLKGLINIGLHKFTEAEQDIRQAISLLAEEEHAPDSLNAEYHATLALLLLQTGHPAEAEKLLNAQLPALEANPMGVQLFLDALQLKADICKALGKTEEAAQVQANLAAQIARLTELSHQT